MGRVIVILLGIILLSALYFATIKFSVDKIQYDLADRSTFALQKSDLRWAQVQVDGRDLTLRGTAPNDQERLQALDIAKNIWGVRMVEDLITIQTMVEKPAPEITSTVTEKITHQPTPDPDRELKLCQEHFDNLLFEKSIVFATGSADISTDSHVLLNDIATTAKLCPEAQIEIAGHTDNEGDPTMNISLSLDRAESVVRYLADSGISRERLSAVGYGSSIPVDINTTPEGRARNRRIELITKH